MGWSLQHEGWQHLDPTHCQQQTEAKTYVQIEYIKMSTQKTIITQTSSYLSQKLILIGYFIMSTAGIDKCIKKFSCSTTGLVQEGKNKSCMLFTNLQHIHLSGELTLDFRVVPDHDTVLADQQTFEERHKSQPAILADFLTCIHESK